MKCTIPEISWHNRDPVLSIDLQPKTTSTSSEYYRLATSGTDSHILIWYLKRDEDGGSVSLDVVADLTRHQRAVNCVRWSPNGELLASADDEGIIMIWKLKSDNEPVNICDTTSETDKEIWITLKILRGHMEDIYDLSWSPNSAHLISGSVDNTAMVWDVQKGKSTTILKDHKGYVQGVSWDPQNQYLATLCTDRYFRVFDINSKKVVSRNSKCLLPVPESSPLHGKTVRLFHDDMLQTFFRRLAFSPDGEIIVTPSGVAEIEGGDPKPLNTTYIYTRYSLKQPSVILPSPDQYTVAVRFCPLLFQLRPHSDDNPPTIPLPYRMVFAVATTKNCVYLYDTQQKIPFGVISNIHYTRLTDLTWSHDGRCLIVSSTDGFCSIILFNANEIGVEYNKVEEAVGTELKSDVVEMTLKDDDVVTTPKKSDPIPQLLENSTLIMPPIISSDEKFESPEKKGHPATPIAVRRFPRKSLDTPTMSPVASNTTKSKDSEQPTSAKKTMPIEVRRKPRALIEKPQPSAPPQVEEAVDAWPIDQPVPFLSPALPKSVSAEGGALAQGSNTSHTSELDSESNMQLIYEDDDEEMPEVLNNVAAVEAPVTPVANRSTQESNTGTPKTPRRVDFKTISTPKSKKKLL